jgi:Carboxypeptidase regulatory-like domain/TonB dependent receptor-like, beta-barrel
MSRIMGCILFLLLGVGVALAQLPSGTILGVVKDASGGVVPGAAVTARSVDTGQSRSAVTEADGSYRFNALPVGNYEVRVEAKGFQVAVHSGLTLTVAQQAVVNFALQVGEASQSVVVTTEAPLVNTTSGALGGLVNEQKVADLPLNGRNYIDLSLLQPGVNVAMNRSAGEAAWFSSNGAPVLSNYYLLDGTPTRNLYGRNPSSQVATVLGVDGVKEYRLITNAMPAQYGMSMGSELEVVSKSGTNSFHGDAFEYLRNSSLDARNFFEAQPAQLGGRRIPAFTQNQFGASLGGPIQKDKTFFYANWESLHSRTGKTQLVATLAPGCFGAANAVVWNGVGTQPSGSVGPCPQIGLNPADATQPYTVSIAPVMAPLIALYPAANLPGNIYNFGFSSPLLDNFGQLRLDHTFSANDSAFGRFTTDHANQTYYSQPFPQFTDIPQSQNSYVTFGETHIIDANLLNTARLSWAGTRLHTLGPLPYTGPQYSFVPGLSLGDINVPGLGQFGPDTPLPINYTQYIWTVSDDMFYTRGKHSLKFGTLINEITMEPQGSANIRGSVTFSSFANFLQGLPSVEAALTPGSIFYRTYRNETFGFYMQDDYRASSRLTLNLGLRYEFNTLPNDVHGYQASIKNPYLGSTPVIGPVIGINHSLRNFSPRVGFAWDVFGDGKTAIRGGFALLYDISNLGGTLGTVGLSQPPFSSSSTVHLSGTLLSLPLVFPSSAAGTTLNMEDYSFNQPSLKQFNLTVERQLPGQMALTVSYAGSLGQHLIDSALEGNPFVPQGVPDANGNCVARPAGQSVNLTSMVDGSATACWLGGDPRVNQNSGLASGKPWGHIAYRTANGSSWYNSLQVMLVKQLSKGLQFQSSYTWSKSLDTLQNEFGSDNTFTEAPSPTDSFNVRTDRGPSVFNSSQNWHFNVLYRLPSPQSSGFVGKMLGGWWVAGIETLQSGYPFTACLSSNQSNSGVIQGAGSSCAERPDLVAGRSLSSITSGTSSGCTIGAETVAAGTPLGTPNLWFDPCAFTIQRAGFLGTEGRNILNGPKFADTDFTIAKDTKLGFLGEAGNLEFRAEMFNIMNHANFQFGNNGAGAALALDTSSAGILLDTANSARQIQFALKLLF